MKRFSDLAISEFETDCEFGKTLAHLCDGFAFFGAATPAVFEFEEWRFEEAEAGPTQKPDPREDRRMNEHRRDVRACGIDDDAVAIGSFYLTALYDARGEMKLEGGFRPERATRCPRPHERDRSSFTESVD